MKKLGVKFVISFLIVSLSAFFILPLGYAAKAKQARTGGSGSSGFLT